MKPAIRIENLGKKYRVAQGKPRAGYRTLRESLVDARTEAFSQLRPCLSADSIDRATLEWES